MTQTDSLVFHFLHLPIKVKSEKKYVPKIEIFPLVGYENSFWSSVTRWKSDWWSIIFDHHVNIKVN